MSQKISLGILTIPPARTGAYLNTLHQWGELPDVVPVPDAARLLGMLCNQNTKAIYKALETAIRAREIRYWGLSDDGGWYEGLTKWLTRPTATLPSTLEEALGDGRVRLHTAAMGIRPADAVGLLEKRGRKVPDELKALRPPQEETEAQAVAETSTQRRERLARRYREVKATGVNDYAQRVADEEKITTGRLRQILSGSAGAPVSVSAANPFGIKPKRKC